MGLQDKTTLLVLLLIAAIATQTCEIICFCIQIQIIPTNWTKLHGATKVSTGLSFKFTESLSRPLNLVEELSNECSLTSNRAEKNTGYRQICHFLLSSHVFSV